MLLGSGCRNYRATYVRWDLVPRIIGPYSILTFFSANQRLTYFIGGFVGNHSVIYTVGIVLYSVESYLLLRELCVANNKDKIFCCNLCYQFWRACLVWFGDTNVKDLKLLIVRFFSVVGTISAVVNWYYKVYGYVYCWKLVMRSMGPWGHICWRKTVLVSIYHGPITLKSAILQTEPG